MFCTALVVDAKCLLSVDQNPQIGPLGGIAKLTFFCGLKPLRLRDFKSI